MSCIKDVPTLRGDNYTEWRKEGRFVLRWTGFPQPVRPKDLVRNDKKDDAAWQYKKWLSAIYKEYN
jgi:hypothetical protein